MFRKPCQDVHKKGPLTTSSGCANYRTSTLTHARSKEHQDATKERVMHKDMLCVTQRAHEMATVSALKSCLLASQRRNGILQVPSLIGLLKLLVFLVQKTSMWVLNAS